MNAKTGVGEPNNAVARSATSAGSPGGGPYTVFLGCLPFAADMDGPQAGIVARALDPGGVTVFRGWHEVDLDSPELGDREAG